MRVFWMVVAIHGCDSGQHGRDPSSGRGKPERADYLRRGPAPKKKVDVTKDKEVCGKSEIYDASRWSWARTRA